MTDSPAGRLPSPPMSTEERRKRNLEARWSRITPPWKRQQMEQDIVGFRGDFITIERHNGTVWVMVGARPFARIFDQTAIPAFWAAYNRGLGVAREIARQGI